MPLNRVIDNSNTLANQSEELIFPRKEKKKKPQEKQKN